MSDFMISLEVMGLGMAGIFAVMLVIMGVVVLLGKLGGSGKKDDQ